MIIATEDNALVVQIHTRVGADVKETLAVEDIDAHRIGWDSWIINTDYLLSDDWMALALRSRGAVLGDETQSADTNLRRAKIGSEQAQAVHDICPTYIGDLHPHVVFVGERPNPASRLPLMTFQPGGTGCGDFFLKALKPVMEEYRVGFMNAYYQNRQQILPFANGARRYVALGRVAADGLAEQIDTYGRVDHPQYVRRFHHLRLSEYSAHLMLAAASQDNYEGLIR